MHFVRYAGLAFLIVLTGCGTSSPPAAPAPAPVSDAEQLLKLHEKVLVAHREQNVEKLLEDEPDDYVIGSRGEVLQPTKSQRAATLGPYLANTRFTTYIDIVPPIVKVSADGTLGWVVVTVSGLGTQRTAEGPRDIEFTSAWIELYEKREGRWLRIGNVSSFKRPM
ncbi:MAG TPA: hypothetical protein VEK57_27995 [Thermoanaerobaculia bacterium]|nr:hypothetical protein [Thermoanaerobaculia bacterium]